VREAIEKKTTEYSSITIPKSVLLEFKTVADEIRNKLKKTSKEFTQADALIELISIYKNRKEMK